MSKNYYVMSSGRVRRNQNTLWIEAADGAKKPIPVEDVDSLYVYGEVDINTRLLNFLSQKRIPLHIFNYYGFYSGSYYPREFLHSGYLLVEQVAHYQDDGQRMTLAREIVRGAAHSLLKNVAYYARRKGSAADPDPDPPGEIDVAATASVSEASAIPSDESLEEVVDNWRSADAHDLGFDIAEPPDRSDAGSVLPHSLQDPPEGEEELGRLALPDLASIRAAMERLASQIDNQTDVNALRGVEGKLRERYFEAWRGIISSDWAFHRRVRRPPDNEVNALISFGNGVLYAACLAELYRTQLTPTISYLHEPGARRFSMALDLSELFKPLIVDRAIFRLLNTGQLEASHFDRSLDGCFLTDTGKRLFLGALEERMSTTIRHRRLGRHVSYRHLIRLECYKLIRHLTGIEEYRAFRAWW